jgi:hypothetical protein
MGDRSTERARATVPRGCKTGESESEEPGEGGIIFAFAWVVCAARSVHNTQTRIPPEPVLLRLLAPAKFI